jgi:glycosyltransferase involved in cell wall biosynthesis
MIVNWLRGLERAGCRVLFIDRLDPGLGDVPAGLAWIGDVMAGAGFGDSWMMLLGDGDAAGLDRTQFEDAATGAVLLNVMGYLDDADLLGRFHRRIFLDIDPGFGQAWQHSGLARVFHGHDVYATVGLGVGKPTCGVPDLGIAWVPTLPPVDLDAWKCSAPPAGRLTTIASWRGPFAPVNVDGTVYGLRVHEARAYAELPSRVEIEMELALDIANEADGPDLRRLVEGGWLVRDPFDVASDLHAYRHFIHHSIGEFSVAKQVYVGLRTGWFSDRSACYLASGRPVIVSDTGISGLLPTGEGLLTYRNLDEAVEAVAEVAKDPTRHGKAARGLATDLFDCRAVARSLLERAA